MHAVPPAVISISMVLRKETVLFNYLLDMSCVTGGRKYSITTEIYANNYSSRQLINQSSIAERNVRHEVSNLIPGTRYHYCVVLSSIAHLSMRICVDDLPDGHRGVFTTKKPNPPDKINGAVLVSVGTQKDLVIYACLDDVERFDDGTIVVLPDFDVVAQTYSINGSCTSKPYNTGTCMTIV